MRRLKTSVMVLAFAFAALAACVTSARHDEQIAESDSAVFDAAIEQFVATMDTADVCVVRNSYPDGRPFVNLQRPALHKAFTDLTQGDSNAFARANAASVPLPSLAKEVILIEESFVADESDLKTHWSRIRDQ